MRYLNNNYKNLILLLIGITLLALGVILLVISGLGSDPITVLNEGVATFLQIEIGYGALLNNLILFIIVIIINRQSLGIGTFVAAFLLGPLMNLFAFILPKEFSNFFIVNLAYSLLGIIVCSFGLSLYIFSNTGLGPFEEIINILKRLTKLPFAVNKIILDAVFFSTGYLLGGVAGVATILAVLLMGPLIQLFTFLLNLIPFKKTS